MSDYSKWPPDVWGSEGFPETVAARGVVAEMDDAIDLIRDVQSSQHWLYVRRHGQADLLDALLESRAKLSAVLDRYHAPADENGAPISVASLYPKAER